MGYRLLWTLCGCALAAAAVAENFVVGNPAEFQAALTAAQSNGQNDTIAVQQCAGEGCAAGAYVITSPLTYTATASEAFSLVIAGDDPASRILDGGATVSILRIDTSAADGFGEIEVSGLTFRNGRATGTGTGDGGALYVLAGAERVAVANTRFEANVADGDGGALFVRVSGSTEAPVLISLSEFEGNQALGLAGDGTGRGGGAHVQAPSFAAAQIFGGDFRNNTAAGSGGGLFVDGTTEFDPYPTLVTLFDVSFEGNDATGGAGGGADVGAATIEIERSGFVRNTAAADGGGLNAREYLAIEMVNTGFAFNESGARGGGLATGTAIDAFGVTLTNNTIVENSADQQAGGLYLSIAGSTAVAAIYNNILHGNATTAGSATDVFVDNDPLSDIPVQVEFFNNDITSFAGFPDASSSFGVTDSGALSSGGNIDGVPILPGLADPEPSPAQGAGSPTIDAGLNAAPARPLQDFELDLRPLDGDGDGEAMVDIGMDEFTGEEVASADLAVTREAAPDPVDSGQTLTYTIDVRNNGPDDATGVELTEVLDPSLTLVSATFAGGTPCLQPDAVVCAIGELAADAAVIVTIVTTAPDVTAVGDLVSTASVSANEADPDPANDTASSQTQVVPVIPPVADLSVSIDDDPDPAYVLGRDITYAVTVDNNGPDTATAVALTAVLPAGLTFRSATVTAGACDATPDAMGRLDCNLDDLPVGNNATLTVTASPAPVTVPVELTLTAAVSAAEQDPDTADNEASETTAVNPPAADYGVTVTSTPDEPTVGEQITVTVTAGNAGPSAAVDAGLTVALPAQASEVTFEADEAACDLSAGTLSCALGDLAIGGTSVVQVSFTAPDVAAVLEVVATVQAEVYDPDGSDNTATETIEVIDVIPIVIEGEGGTGAIGWLEVLAAAFGTSLVLVRRMAAAAGTAAAGAPGPLLRILALPAALTVLLAVSGAREASARDRGFYAGVSVGQADAGYDASDLAADLAGRGWSISDASTDDADFAWKFYGGFALNRILALEAAWVDLGEVETRFGASVPPGEVETILRDTAEVHPYLGSGPAFSAVVRWEPLPDRLSLHARAGVFFWNADIDVAVVEGMTEGVTGLSTDDSGSNFMYGAGVEWRLSPTWSLTGEWERYRMNDWVDVPTVGAKYRFGR